MKNIFQQVGIQIDRGKKTDNLNHRFRHGFAMFKVLHEGFDEIKLAYVMRHSNTNSVSAYFNPTEDDLIVFASKQDANQERFKAMTTATKSLKFDKFPIKLSKTFKNM